MMQSKGHALFYMIGYCMKDRGQAHFRYVVVNLTREMLRAGISAYNGVTTAAASINNKNTALCRRTWFHSVMKFVSTKLKGLNPTPCPMRVVTWMLREADFEVHTNWVEAKFGSLVEVSYLHNALMLVARPIEATRGAVIHLVTGQPAGIAYYCDNANRAYSENRLNMTSDHMRFAIDNGEDHHYAHVTLQEAIARSTNPAELMNTPVNSDDDMDDEEMSNLPENQRPLPLADNDYILRERYVDGGAFEFMQQRGYSARDNIRYSDAVATAQRRATREANRERQRVYRENLQERFDATQPPSTTAAPAHLPHPSATLPDDEPGPDQPTPEDQGVFDLSALMSATSRN